MDDLIQTPAEATHCSLCSAPLAADQNFCVNCGYPEKGTESEKAKFHADRVQNQRKQQFAKKELKTGRIILLVIAGLSFLSGLFYFFAMDDSASLIASGILSIVYLALAYWSQQKPLIAMVLGLLVYLTTIVINGIVEPETIHRGIIMKVIIIAFLGKGINSALQLRKNK